MTKPTSNAVQVCSKIRIDISSLRSTSISEQIIREADLTLAMERHHLNEMVQSFNAPSEKLFLCGDFHTDKPGMVIEAHYGILISCSWNILQITCQCSDGLTDPMKHSF